MFFNLSAKVPRYENKGFHAKELNTFYLQLLIAGK